MVDHVKRPYDVLLDGLAIRCGTCGHVSLDRRDVRLRYCPACALFHEGPPAEEQLPPPVAIAIRAPVHVLTLPAGMEVIQCRHCHQPFAWPTTAIVEPRCPDCDPRPRSSNRKRTAMALASAINTKGTS